MQDILSELTQLPGVKQAAVISSDGVPVCVLERAGGAGGEFIDCTSSSQTSLEGQRIDPASLVALAASWVDDVMRAGSQIAWELPKRFVLAASQGSLVVQQGPNAHVMAVLEPGTSTDLVSLPLEVAVERLHKLLRDLGRFDPDQSPAALPSGRPAGSTPGANASPMTSPSAADRDADGRRPSTSGGPEAAASNLLEPGDPAESAPFDATGDH